MQSGTAQKIDKIRRSLSLVKPIVTLSVGVVLPVLLSTAVGIVAIVVGESSLTLILGILVVSFTAAAIGGAVILYVLLGRRARIARLQSDLLANVTHDLRTPLAAIRRFQGHLEDRRERPQVLRFPAEIARRISRRRRWPGIKPPQGEVQHRRERDPGEIRNQQASLLQQVRTSQFALSMLAYPETQAIPISAAHLSGSVLLDRDRNTVALVMWHLPELSEKQTYQAWLIESDGQRVSAGVFRPQENISYTTHPVYAKQELSYFVGLGVTVEPAGGSKQPTGQRIFKVDF